jgi:hypothetical protein
MTKKKKQRKHSKNRTAEVTKLLHARQPNTLHQDILTQVLESNRAPLSLLASLAML